LRSLLVTSAEPGEGKTFIALNLALMLAVSPRCRVLLVDASVDRAQFPMRFDLPSGPGLRDVIAGEPWSAAARKVPDMELYVLTLGLAQPSSFEPLDTRSLKLWLDQVRSEFDWIILDGPALTASPEAEALAFATDGTLLVLDPGKARASLVSRALGHVDPARLAGVVFNRKPRPDER
jgi:Mrp family chromosome partitioning ATPase